MFKTTETKTQTNTEFLALPNIPKPERINNKFILNFLFIIILCAASILFYFSFKQKPTQNFTQTNKPKEKITVDYMRTLMLAKSVLTFSQTNSNTPIQTSELPKTLKTLIPAEALQIEVFSFQNLNSKTGYKINFAIPKNMHAYFFETRKNLVTQNWNLSLGNRSDLVNFLELTNSNYQSRFEITPISKEIVTPENQEQISEESTESRVTIQIETK